LELFLALMTNLTNSSQVKTDNKPESAKTEEDTGPSQEETMAALKAEAALAGQEQQLSEAKKKIDDKTPQTQLIKAEPSSEGVPSSSGTSSQNPNGTSQTVAVQRISSDSTVPRNSYVPQPQPIRIQPRNIPNLGKTGVNTAKSLSSGGIVPTVDPLTRWNTLAMLGSYGEKSNDKNPDFQRYLESNEANPSDNEEIAQTGIIPRTQSIFGQNPRSNPPVANSTASDFRQFPTASVSSQITEEQRFLQEKSPQQLTIGQTALGQLQSALVWETSRGQKDSDVAERFVVTLSTPLTNAQGEEILPVGTPMLVAVQSVHESGRVTAVVEAVVKDGTEYPLPPGSIFLRGTGGNPLIANLVQGGNSQQMNANVTTFMLGALSKTGELLNRGSTSTFVSGGNFSQTQEFNSPNYIGGLLEGGFTPLAERLNQQHENRLSSLDSRTPLWIVEKGSTVEIFVNQSISF
jgi:hypothetical protein